MRSFRFFLAVVPFIISTACAQLHFVPVDPTDIPLIMFVTEATLQSEPLVPRDEIAAFDGELCVGAAVVDDQWPLPFTIWMEDEENGLPGMTPGNWLSYRFWINDEQNEYPAELSYFSHSDFIFEIALFVDPIHQHFIPPEPNPVDHMIEVTEAVYDGEPLQPGDEIAAFDGDQCVGMRWVNGEWPLSFNAWGAGEDHPGYTNGHLINFRVWKQDLEEELPVQINTNHWQQRYNGSRSVVSLEAFLPGFYFTPVEPTGRPFAVIIEEATLDGVPLQNYDEIGVRSGDYTVGAAAVTGEWPVPLTIWEGDPEQGLPGWTFGEPLNFYCWLYRERREFWCEAELEIDPWGPYYIGHLTATTEAEFAVPLRGNRFELASTYILPEDRQCDNVFASIADVLEIAYFDDGHIWIPPIPLWVEFPLLKASQMYLTEDAVWTLVGLYTDPLSQFTLESGRWNWMGYPLPFITQAEDALQEAADDIAILMNSDGELWIPQYGINTIGFLTPGDGYYVYVNQEVTFRFHGQPVDGMVASAGDEYLDEDTELIPRTGLPWAVVVDVGNLAGRNPASVDIFDEDLRVGQAVIEQDQTRVPVVCWQGSPEHGLPGFTEGHSITARALAADGSVLAVTHEGKFGEGAYGEMVLEKVESSLPASFEMGNGYPNPFNSSSVVPFTLPRAGEITLTVFNILGQQVYSLRQTFDSGKQRLTIDASTFSGKGQHNPVSGVYLLQLSFNGEVKTQKVVLVQ